MSSPDPLRALEVHQNYLIIASVRHDEFAREACTEVIAELERMQRDFGMSQEMVDGLSSVLRDETKQPQACAREAASLIGKVIELTRQSAQP